MGILGERRESGTVLKKNWFSWDDWDKWDKNGNILFNLAKLHLTVSKSLLTQEFLKNGIDGISGIA